MKALYLLPLLAALGFGSQAAARDGLLEPRLHVAPGGKTPRVALTFDACMGLADQRILSVLVDNRIPATIFITERWLKRNAATLAIFLAHPDLFELENHGAMHVPAIDRPQAVYGIASAGSAEAVEAEVSGGAHALVADGAPQPHWFRGATAKYTASSIAQIRALGFDVAGYSLNGDDGSLLGAKMATRRIAGARDGDVIISHINQPTHAAGEGVAAGILALKAKGYAFVRLDAVHEDGTNATVN
ncbi:polysaccharide deacetylase [Rhizobium sp. Leaf384]|uniref:polysaccharide deacetylase family protein n=1 Tax=unclassified Rhizobium TaxID=2613769 RepID=UPI000713FC39|nr:MULTISPECIES: polysaccharide deacetylase family protein [unclassified Rhizobium]KQS74445.1 polysaccharide deacetylase [Rhizobium sp. Leaf383]KQS80183.1 polysaccharide deacetylase [Rhizobium sp. Leaf384]